MDLPLVLAVSALAGFCAKFADEIADRRIPLIEAYAAAILYGLLSGFLASGGELSSLLLGMAVASILARKFDHSLHIAGLATFAFVLLVFPMQAFSPILFSFFMLGALLDELELPFAKLKLFADRRLVLPIFAALVLVWTAQPLFIIAILFFDGGYRLGGYSTERIFPPKKKIAPGKRAKQGARRKS